MTLGACISTQPLIQIITGIFGSSHSDTTPSEHLQPLLANVFVRRKKRSSFVCWAEEPWVADRCAAEELFCSTEVIMCKKTTLGDESQLSGMMTKIIELTFGPGCICREAAEKQHNAAPSDVWLLSGRGAQDGTRGCGRAGISQASLWGTGLLREVGIRHLQPTIPALSEAVPVERSNPCQGTELCPHRLCWGRAAAPGNTRGAR